MQTTEKRTAHTPGPWQANKCLAPSRAWSINPTPRTTVAGISGGSLNDKSDEELEANARLIAAAPDAHEILLVIHEFFRHWNAADPSTLLRDDGTTLKQAVEAYITKATT